MKKLMQTKDGYSLIELLLVLVVVSMILFISLNYSVKKAEQDRIDRTVTQMQQILNAALAYYVANNAWPTSLAVLTPTYLPATLNSPWGGVAYSVANTNNMFYVYVPVVTTTAGRATAIANSIAGLLPLSYTSTSATAPPAVAACGAASLTCRVVAAVNVPGQNLSMAGSVNYAGLYHHGGCVPKIACPADATGTPMVPQIMVVPVSVSGVNDAGSSNVYPISSFTAYAMDNNSLSPPACSGGTFIACPVAAPNTGVTQYWRVCLQVVTESGNVASTNTGTGASAWGQYVTLLALTRCASTTEPDGGGFSVFTD